MHGGRVRVLQKLRTACEGLCGAVNNEAEKKEWFAEKCAALGLDPAKSTIVDYLETDDRVSFKK
jgi:hypothetical protein